MKEIGSIPFVVFINQIPTMAKYTQKSNITIMLPLEMIKVGELAQVVERPLSMQEVPGSIPGFSKGAFFF